MHPPCTIVVTVSTVAVAWQGRIRSHLFGVRLSSSVGRVQGIMRNLPACMLIRSYHVHDSRLDYPSNDYRVSCQTPWATITNTHLINVVYIRSSCGCRHLISQVSCQSSSKLHCLEHRVNLGMQRLDGGVNPPPSMPKHTIQKHKLQNYLKYPRPECNMIQSCVFVVYYYKALFGGCTLPIVLMPTSCHQRSASPIAS